MEESAEKTSISLFPAQRQIVSDFAMQDRRSFSNALQVIIEEWARFKREAARPTTEHYVATSEAETR